MWARFTYQASIEKHLVSMIDGGMEPNFNLIHAGELEKIPPVLQENAPSSLSMPGAGNGPEIG